MWTTRKGKSTATEIVSSRPTSMRHAMALPVRLVLSALAILAPAVVLVVLVETEALAESATAEVKQGQVAVSAEFILGTLLAAISTLAAWLYRAHAKQVAEAFARVNKEMSDLEKRLSDDISGNELEFNREMKKVVDMHDKDHQGAKEGLRIMMEQHGKVMTEIWEEIKQSRRDRIENEGKLWEAIDRITDKVSNLHLELAKSYPTKEEISKLFDEKLRAFKDTLRN